MRQLKTVSALSALCVVSVLLVALDQRLPTGIGILLYLPFLLIAFLVISRLPLDDPLGPDEQPRQPSARSASVPEGSNRGLSG